MAATKSMARPATVALLSILDAHGSASDDHTAATFVLSADDADTLQIIDELVAEEAHLLVEALCALGVVHDRPLRSRLLDVLLVHAITLPDAPDGLSSRIHLPIGCTAGLLPTTGCAAIAFLIA